jgi:hypothetical protein
MGGITIVENSSKQETKKQSSTLNIPTLTKEKALKKFLFHQPPSFFFPN